MTKTDREQIEELIATYANALDTKDYPAVEACFMADATVRYEGYSHTLKGHTEIAAHMKRALQPLDATQHLFTNFIIDIEGNTGRLRCSILAQHVRLGTVGGDKYLAGGEYDAELRRASGKWEFAHVTARTLWGDGNRAVLPKAE